MIGFFHNIDVGKIKNCNIFISKISFNSLRPSNAYIMVPSHYLNQWWYIVNWTLRSKLQWNFNRNSYISTHENAFGNVAWKMASIFLSASTYLIFRTRFLQPGPWFNINMSSYQYRKTHCGDKTILRSSYFHNGISYTGKISSLHWIRAHTFYTIWPTRSLDTPWHFMC